MLQLYGYDRNKCQLSQSCRQIMAKTVKYSTFRQRLTPKFGSVMFSKVSHFQSSPYVLRNEIFTTQAESRFSNNSPQANGSVLICQIWQSMLNEDIIQGTPPRPATTILQPASLRCDSSQWGRRRATLTSVWRA